MKNALLRLSFALLFSCFTALAQAQTTAPAAAQPGYWNLETNLTTRAYTIVRFYNGEDQLVYEETIPGLCLDFSHRKGLCRRRTRQLNSALQQVLLDPATAQPATLLAQQFGQGRQPRTYATR